MANSNHTTRRTVLGLAGGAAALVIVRPADDLEGRVAIGDIERKREELVGPILRRDVVHGAGVAGGADYTVAAF